jgi:hypothetical protein
VKYSLTGIGLFSQNSEVEIRLCRAHNKGKNVTLTLHGRFEADRKIRVRTPKPDAGN